MKSAQPHRLKKIKNYEINGEVCTTAYIWIANQIHKMAD